MLYDAHQHGQIIQRCWMIYEPVNDTFEPPNEFHVEYPSLVELALSSGYFKLLAALSKSGHSIHIHEEYGFSEYKLIQQERMNLQ